MLPNKGYTFEKLYSFAVGSYSGYGYWRDKLEELKGKEAFQELIHFADNEGVIGLLSAKNF